MEIPGIDPGIVAALQAIAKVQADVAAHKAGLPVPTPATASTPPDGVPVYVEDVKDPIARYFLRVLRRVKETHVVGTVPNVLADALLMAICEDAQAASLREELLTELQVATPEELQALAQTLKAKRGA